MLKVENGKLKDTFQLSTLNSQLSIDFMVLNILAIIIAVALIVLILLQMQGSGLSSAFGGGGEFYRSRQSIEKILVVATVVFSLLFGILSVILLIPR